MGRPRKFKTPEDLQAAWEAYTDRCDNVAVLTHAFSAHNSEFVSTTLRRAVTYTITGFCLFSGISRSAFYKTYSNDPVFVDAVTCARDSCEVDARHKFELGILPTRLAGLWMSNYSYGIKAEADFSGTAPVVISGGEHHDIQV